MSIPPAFPKTFYRKLEAFAREFKITRVSFVLRAMEHYAQQLRMKRSPAAKTVGREDAKRYGELSSRFVKKWWSTVPEEERKERAQKAAAARWGKQGKKKPG